MVPLAPLRRWLLLALTVAAAAAVLWAFDALPMQDLPAHAGLIALRHRLPASPFEQRYLALSPHLGPYSLFRTAGEGLRGLLGPVGAVRMLMTFAVVSVPASLGWARHRLHGNGAVPAALLGLCWALGFVTALGFASYLLGLSALMVAHAVWLAALTEPEPREGAPAKGVMLAGVSLAVLFVHGFAFLVHAGLVAAAWLSQRERPRVSRLVPLLPALAMAAFMAWQDHVRGPEVLASPGMPPGVHYAGLADKLGLLASPTLMTRWGVDLLVGVLLWALLAAGLAATVRPSGAAAGRGAPPRRRASLGCLAAIAVAFLAAPRSVGWFGFVDGRLVPVFLLVGVLAVERSALSSAVAAAWDRGPQLAAVTLVAVAWVASYRFQREAAGWPDVAAAIPEHSLLLNLPLDPDSDVFTAHPFVHYDKLVVAEKPVVVSDVWFHQGTALEPRRESPALRLPAEYSESNLQRIDWASYRLDDWDYVLLRTKPEATPPAVPDTLARVVHVGGWWLFATHAGRLREPSEPALPAPRRK